MKRVFTFGLALAFAAILVKPADAQMPGNIVLGLQGGGTYSTVTGDDVTDKSYDFSFMGGVHAGFRSNQYWAVQLEANYVELKSKDVTAGGPVPVTAGKLKVTYLDIPLTIQAVIPATEMLAFTIYGGGALGIKLSCDADGVDCKDSMKSTAFSLPFGAMLGYELAGGSIIGLDLRYVLGITDVFETGALKTNSFQAMLRWTYVLQ